MPFMETISDDIIDESTEELHNLEAEELRKMVYKMSEEQPDLLNYLLTVGQEELSNEEQEVLLFLGVNIWNAFKKIKEPSFVSDKVIHEKNTHNEALIETLENNAHEGFTKAANDLIGDHPQAPLLGYVINAIVEEDMEEEEPLVNEENKDLVFLTLKTYIESICA